MIRGLPPSGETIEATGVATGSDSAWAEGGALGPGEVACLECDRPNPRERKFCGGCGSPLWDACPKCQTPHPLGEAFCGDCGANLAAAFQERLRRVEADIARAKELASVHRYDDAVALLDVVARKENHFRLKRQLAAASTLRAELAELGKSHRGSAEEAVRQAKKLLESYAFERAIVELEATPAGLRSKEHERLLEEARGAWREILALSGRVREGLQAGKTFELLPDIERLLALKPDHEQARKLANQIRDRAVAAAKKGIAENKHAAALKLLMQVRRVSESSEIDELYETCREMAWLLADLKEAPVADEGLLAICERLLKLSPQHPQAAGLLEKIKQRLKLAPADPRAAAAAWAPSQERTILGAPVEWLGGFARLPKGAACDGRLLRQHPGRFHVAYGLALQALDKAPIAVNLLPQAKGSLADRLSLGKLASFGRRAAPRSAWGIDLSSSSLKAVKLSLDEKTGAIALEDIALLHHKRIATQPDGSADRTDLLKESLARFLAEHPLADERVAVSVSSIKLLMRLLQLPAAKGKKFVELVQYEATHQIPFPLNELVWDYQALDLAAPGAVRGGMRGAVAAEGDGRKQVLLVAAKDHAVNYLSAMFEELGARLDIIQSDSLALHNAAIAEFFEEATETGAADPPQAEPSKANGPATPAIWRPKSGNSAVAFIDIGADGANLVVCSPLVVWWRSLRMGGNDFTNRLVQEYQWTTAHAEQMKRSLGDVESICQFYETLAPVFTQLIREIERSFESFRTEQPDLKIERIYGLGGGFHQHGMLRYLRNGLPDSSEMRPA